MVTVLAATLLRRILVRRLSRTAAATATDWDDFILRLAECTRTLPILLVAVYVGARWLELPAKPNGFVHGVAILAIMVQAALWSASGIEFWVDRYRRLHLDSDPASATTIIALRFLGKLAVYSTLLLLALDNLGFDVTALIAGLGVGGIAVALAVQSILGDLFASLSIVIDKPFVIGDFVVVGDLAGTVEYIGLKTTRVRSLSGEQLVFSNSDLLSSRIRNFKRMAERRVLFRFGVVYQTPPEALETIPATVRGIVEAQESARFDRAHFAGFGESAFDFEIVYYVLTPDYNAYMDTQQAINLSILRTFREQGIEFAYPTRTVFLEKAGGEATRGETSIAPGREESGPAS